MSVPNQTKEQQDNLTNYTSFVIYKGRYGDTFQFEPVESGKYIFQHSNLDYCRYGGHEGAHGLDYNDLGMVDLGMVDPSGGPAFFVNWFKIDGKIVTRISVEDSKIYFYTNKEVS